MANCYIRFTVTAVRPGTDGIMQFADLNFYDSSENRIAYPSGTTVTTNMSTFSGEGAANILDNNSSTKVCGSWNGSAKYFLITIPDETFLQSIKKYNYCTANDSYPRDPISWTLETSLDGETYLVRDEETNVSITTSRRTQTQKWNCGPPPAYKSYGAAILTISSYTSGGNDTLVWTAVTPEDTSLTLSTSVNNGAWQSVSNNGVIPNMVAKGQTCNLRVKAELATADTDKTPTISRIAILTDEDKKVLILTPTLPSDLRGNVGNMSVIYDGLGGLQGTGGPTVSFVGTFAPTSMAWRPNPADEENIDLGITATVVLTKISYTSAESKEHISLGISASLTLTNIHDI